MNLAFSISYYTPYSSGLTLYVKRLVETLVKRNYRCSVVTMRHRKDLDNFQKINGVDIFRAKPLFSINKGFISYDFIRLSLRRVLESDVIIVNLPQFEGFIPALWGRLFGKKVISIYHCEVVLPAGLFNYFSESVLHISNALTLLLSQEIVTYTKDFSQNSRILSFFQKKIKFVYPPILRPIVDKGVQKSLIKKTKTADFIIGVAARLAAEKGLEYLFEAIPQIQKLLETENIKIVVAGSMSPVGERKYKKRIKKLVEKYQDNIVFLGELPEEKMGSFYSLLDVLVLPSTNSTEAFGMVQVEAMMMGVPVVSTDLPGVRVPIRVTGMGRTVPVANSQVLAEAVVEVIKHKNKFRKNERIAWKEFDMDKTVSFFDKLLKG